MKVTVTELAKHLDLAISTVSRALNNYEDVSPATRERVLEAARELGYEPSAAARSLRSKRTGRLGFYVYAESLGSLQRAFFFSLIRGAAMVAEAADYNLVLYSKGNTSMERLRRICRSHEVDGLLLVRGLVSEPTLAEPFEVLLESDLPFVALHEPGDDPRVSFVSPDDQMGGYLATQHLISQGNKRIAFVGRLHDERPDYDRRIGYRRALATSGLPYDESLVVHGRYDENLDQLRADLSRLFALQNPPTAIFTFNDDWAELVGGVLAELGCRVPDDVALVGYDDFEDACAFTPPLTTVRQDVVEMGKFATEALLAQIDKPDMAPVRRTVPVELIVRESSVRKGDRR